MSNTSSGSVDIRLAVKNQKKFKKDMDSGASSVKKFGANLGKAAAAAGVATLAFAKIGIDNAIAQGNTFSHLNAQLDLSGDKAKSLNKNVRELYMSGIGESLDEIAGVAADVGKNLELDVASKGAKYLTRDILAVSKAMNQDPGELISALGSMKGSGTIKSYAEGLDILARSAATGGDRAGDLLDTYKEYSPHFSKLGLTAEAFAAQLAGIPKGLAFNTDKVADAYKELAIRAADGSKASQEALGTLGFDPNSTADQIAKGGPGALKAMKAIHSKLRKMGAGSQREQLMAALYGAPGEDLTSDVLFAIDMDAKSLKGVDGATKRVRDQGKGAAQEFTAFKREVEATGIAVATHLIPHIRSVAKDVKPVVKAVGEFADEHPGLVKVGVALAMASTAVAGMRFAGAITGVTKLSTTLWGLANGSKTIGATLGKNVGDEAVKKTNAAISRDGAITGPVKARMGPIGRVLGTSLGGAMGAAAIVGIGGAIGDYLDSKTRDANGKTIDDHIQGRPGRQNGSFFSDPLGAAKDGVNNGPIGDLGRGIKNVFGGGEKGESELDRMMRLDAARKKGPRKSAGGYVAGARGIDNRNIRATPGEYIVPKARAQAAGPEALATVGASSGLPLQNHVSITINEREFAKAVADSVATQKARR